MRPITDNWPSDHIKTLFCCVLTFKSLSQRRYPTYQVAQRPRTIAHPPDKKRRLEKRERKRRQSLDGDGSWRLKTGDRRVEERRASEEDQSHIIHLPFLDDIFDTDDESEDVNVTQASPETHQPCDSDHNSLITGKTASKTDTVSDTDKRKPLDPEEQARLHSLKTMLDASNARYKQATRNRRPVFAAGLEVRVTKGEHSGKKGVVLDADYIENRALISLPDQQSPHWIGFNSLGHAD